MKDSEDRTQQLSLSELEELRSANPRPQASPATERQSPLTEEQPESRQRTPASHRSARAVASKLGSDQQMAAVAALGLAASLALPWYSKTYGAVINGKLQQASDSLSAFGVFSFIEAAVLLISLGVVALLLARVDHRNFHLPGGDGTVVMGAGIWAGVLIVIRMFDRPSPASGAQGTNIGIEWGIFIALVAAAALAYAGFRMRQVKAENN